MSKPAMQRARTVSDVNRDDRDEEGRLFTSDTFDHENEGRFEIDPFRFARYVVLGWIREIEAFPYYQLTTNGEDVYWKFHADVDPHRLWGWDEDDDD